MQPARYHFGESFQRQAAAAIVQDEGVLARCRDAVRPAFFEDRFLSLVVGEAIQHYDQFHKLPTFDTLEQRTLSRARATGMDGSETATAQDYVRRLAYYTVGDMEYVVAEMAQFGRSQATREALMQAVDLSQEHSADPDTPSRIAKLLQDASTIGLHSDIGVEVFDYLHDLGKLWATDPVADPKRKVKTFLSTLTSCMRGGAGAGELVIVVGASKRGKSKVLQRQAAAAIMAGKVPWIVTAELKTPDWTAEVLAALTGIEVTTLRERPQDPQVVQAMWALYQRNVHFKVKYFPPESASPAHIRSYIQRTMRATNSQPDILIVDYLDELKSDRPFRGGSAEAETYMTYGKITSDLVQIGYDLRIPVWTAAQMKRGSYGEEEPGLDSVGESLKKIAKADWVITLAQTKEMKMHKRLDVILAGGRRGPDGIVIPCNIDFSKCYFKELEREAKMPAVAAPVPKGQAAPVWTMPSPQPPAVWVPGGVR